MITMKIFGRYGGRSVAEYTMTNTGGASVSILELGGIITAINLPDKNGRLANVVCGFDTCEGYLKGGGYLNALIGRYANRIAEGKFTLNGKEYQLAKNDGGIGHLHGGNVGLNARFWRVTPITGEGKDALRLEYSSPDGEEGYPGNVKFRVTYTFDDACALSIRYEADTDADTIINLTNHAYFNLAGAGDRDIHAHLLTLDCDRMSPVDDKLIPVGDPLPVAGGPFDFTEAKALGRDIDADDEQIKLGGGYDHNFIFREGRDKSTPAGSLLDPISGRCLTLYTDLPGVQVYTSNMLKGSMPLRGGQAQRPRLGVCLETQFWPDSPNRPDFPSCILRAGEHFDSTTTFAFSVKE